MFRLAERLLSLVVPRATASAACTLSCYCTGGTRYCKQCCLNEGCGCYWADGPC
jgi:hypothetical protein